MANTDKPAGSNKAASSADKPSGVDKLNVNSGTDRREQVPDHGTERMSGDEVANAAAETLHGRRAVEEQYAQPDATALPGGSTLIADTPGEPPAGERVDR